MNRILCYENQCGEQFDDCVKSVTEKVKSMKKRNASAVLLFDGIPLVIKKNTTYKQLKFKYMVEMSKLNRL